MKIVVTNLSGNVGKTVCSRDLLLYRCDGYKLVTIESINGDGTEETVITGDNHLEIFSQVLLEDDLILDIGSSNVEQFLITAKEEPEIIESIDLFIIPTTTGIKEQKDTVKTVLELLDFNVPSEKIKIIFNKVEKNDTIDNQFSSLIKALNKIDIEFDIELFINKHDLYSDDKSLNNLISDRDFKSEMIEAKNKGDADKAKKLSYAYAKSKKAISLNQKYQYIFDKITA